MVKFSIVIPCYNAFYKMKQCLYSLENQTYKNFEVIIIDDRSTDSTYYELEKYIEETCLSIVLLKNEFNMGAGLTRNKGIDAATGEYILFIDSDDFIENVTLDKLNRLILRENADCILFDYKTIGTKTKKNGSTIYGLSQGIVAQSDVLALSIGATWGKVYKIKNIIENEIYFPKFKINEDMPFHKIAVINSEKIYYTKEKLYNYVIHQNSLMQDSTNIDISNDLRAYNMVEEKSENAYYESMEALYVKEVLYSTVVNMCKMNNEKCKIEDKISTLNLKYDNWNKNIYIKKFPLHQKFILKLIELNMITIIKVLVNLNAKIA